MINMLKNLGAGLMVIVIMGAVFSFYIESCKFEPSEAGLRCRPTLFVIVDNIFDRVWRVISGG